MTLERKLQQDSSLGEKILANLIALRDDSGLKNREIAALVGVNENYLSRVFNRNAEGSLQLLKGLELLKEVIELRNQLSHAPQDFRQELAVMRKRIEQMEGLLTRYPEHQPKNLALNEGKVTADEKAAGDRAAVKAIEKSAGGVPPQK